jgi:hypothetical protein
MVERMKAESGAMTRSRICTPEPYPERWEADKRKDFILEGLTAA